MNDNTRLGDVSASHLKGWEAALEHLQYDAHNDVLIPGLQLRQCAVAPYSGLPGVFDGLGISSVPISQEHEALSSRNWEIDWEATLTPAVGLRVLESLLYPDEEYTVRSWRRGGKESVRIEISMQGELSLAWEGPTMAQALRDSYRFLTRRALSLLRDLPFILETLDSSGDRAGDMTLKQLRRWCGVFGVEPKWDFSLWRSEGEEDSLQRVSASLVVNVTYEGVGADGRGDEIVSLLEGVIQDAMNRGALTGESDLVVDGMVYTVDLDGPASDSAERAEALAEHLQAQGFGEEAQSALDDLVHDLCSRTASDVNNGELVCVLQWLLDTQGFTEHDICTSVGAAWPPL